MQHRSDDRRSTPWHALTVRDALAEAHSEAGGLSSAEAAQRLRSHGPNIVPRGKKEPWYRVAGRQLDNPIVWVLIGSGALAIALGKGLDGAVVLVCVVLNALVGLVQELRAGRAIEALALMVPQRTIALRDGRRASIEAAELVPGDVVSLAAGDRVPADLRVLESKNLAVDESALTGESVPVEKSTSQVAEDAALADRKSMLYGGTLVSRGAAAAVVVATAANTELGRISAMLRETTETETPLTRALARVAKLLTIAIGAVAALLLALALLRGFPVVDAVLSAISLAVAAVPEGLPAVITIALAIGVQRMARRHAIVRRLSAVETLGSTSVICSDKTGTLTRNEMTVQALWTPEGGERALEGVGWTPEGRLVARSGEPIEPGHDVRELLQAGLLANDASLEKDGDGRWRAIGDPTEAALVVAARKVGIDESVRERRPRLDVIPFSSELPLMATLHDAEAGTVAYLKGAPEVLLERCEDVDRDAVLAVVESMATRGMRVLAVAERRLPTQGKLDHEQVGSGLRLLGLQGMIDPPRPEAIRAIAQCHAAGVTVKMITGDHRSTAEAIGRQLGILPPGARALTGGELDRLDDVQLAQEVERTHVFARVAPEHKLRLVRALQSNGRVVAMTGDGVNDAPAVRQADIGVAMGITGTSVSKEAADVVLADDNFASIAAAVEEGRRVFDNLVKALAFLLPTNLGQAVVLLVAVLAFPLIGGAPVLPVAPVQILWINLVTGVALALPLAFEAPEPDVMRRPPRAPGAPVLDRFVLVRTLVVGLLMAAGATGLFLYELGHELARGVAEGTALREAQTMAVTTIAFFQVFYLFSCRSLRDSVLDIGLLSNKAVYLGIGALVALQLALVYLPVMNVLFGTAPLPPAELGKSLLVASVVVPVVTIEKWWRRRTAGSRSSGAAALA
ncbi:MAG: HAD-IC family P-type ATPase [Deltaproteobacteria bacterium]|nr:HAD-IC family P-type ATPase [Deltaproteobacteria bacterium]